MTSTMLLVGDVRTRLAPVASGSIHCAVTSPPYFGLRDYGCAEQIGLEPTPDAYVAELVAVFREVRRVLRDDGTLWLNLGDSYASSIKGSGGTNPETSPKQSWKGRENAQAFAPRRVDCGLANKQRIMIPARVALALQKDGWWLRDEIIWHKPNPMPVSVTDRTTPAHEMLYMFSKSARYHYDMGPIREPCSENSHGSPNANRGSKQATLKQQEGGKLGKWTAEDKARGRQPRSVWTVTPKPFKGAHFATFPPDLIRPCILAGCPAGGTVLDPFFGAGTTGLVAAELGRSCIGVELNPAYATIALQRLGLRVLTPSGDIIGRVAA